MIKAAETSYITVTSKKVKRDNDFQLVYVTGKTWTNEVIEDRDFNLKISNCLRLIRKVEMYQYYEIKTVVKEGNTTSNVYSYGKAWYDHHVSSYGFNDPSHKNPSMNFRN